MESARFRYEVDRRGGEAEEEEEEGDGEESSRRLMLPCLLDIYVHHARNIHNICIYADQDVYAKFSLTSTPDHAPALATRVAAGGGANPRFDERLPPLRVLAADVLKCEIWMRSCAARLLDDQLLGFVLVPLAAVAAADGARLARDFALSSTDLFHSPAGTIRLSLALHSASPAGGHPPLERVADEPSITSEVIILEPAPPPPVVDFSRVEFPDLNVAKENHDMAEQYLPFLHLNVAKENHDMEDCEMSTSPLVDKPVSSSDGSKNTSTNTTVSDDRAISSSEATDKTRDDADDAAAAAAPCRSPDTPTSNNGEAGKEEKGAAGDVFKSPLGDIDMEAEQSAMQRQIMEMYMKSMQQFTASLGKMTLPMEVDGDDGVVVQKADKPEAEVKQVKQQVKKEGARVFYGSRAFF